MATAQPQGNSRRQAASSCVVSRELPLKFAEAASRSGDCQRPVLTAASGVSCSCPSKGLRNCSRQGKSTEGELIQLTL